MCSGGHKVDQRTGPGKAMSWIYYGLGSVTINRMLRCCDTVQLKIQSVNVRQHLSIPGARYETQRTGHPRRS